MVSKAKRAVDGAFTGKLTSWIATAKKTVCDRHGFAPVNNVDAICEKVYETRGLPGVLVQCGVFRGYTLLAVAQFCRDAGIDRRSYGFDTFGGFPDGIAHPYDEPGYFKTLHEEGRISPDHFEKARMRTGGFQDTKHLGKGHFEDTASIQEIAKDYPAVSLVKGVFSETLPDFKEKIAVLFIDCDLYQSYLDCLKHLYPQVVDGGAVVFDEYYSLKYPGARVAVDEFFEDKPGHFERYMTSEGFERWCFTKGGKA